MKTTKILLPLLLVASLTFSCTPQDDLNYDDPSQLEQATNGNSSAEVDKDKDGD